MTRIGPGSHLALVSADRRVVVVPGGEDAVGPLWELVAGPIGPDHFERLLDAVLARGLHGRPGFALLLEESDGVRVAVRGVWSHLAPDAAPRGAALEEGWRETRVPAGIPIVLSARDDATAADVLDTHPLPPGPLAVRIGRLETAAVPAPVSVPAPPVLAPPEPLAAPPVVPPPAPVPAPVSAPPPPVVDDPLTVPLAALLGAAPTPVLRLSAGEVGEIALDRPVVIGRAPQALGPDPDEEVLLVPVPSPHHEISSTHLEIRPGVPDPLVPTVTDLGSTNGTLVIRPGRAPETLRPGVPAALAPGVIVDLGDGLTIELGLGA